MRGLDAAGFREFLVQSGRVREPVAVALFEAGMDGAAFGAFNREDYKTLKKDVPGLDSVSVVMLLKLRENVFGAKEEAGTGERKKFEIVNTIRQIQEICE